MRARNGFISEAGSLRSRLNFGFIGGPANPDGYMTVKPIPFNRASLVGNEFRYIFQALEVGHISGDGRFTSLCHQFLEREVGVGKALMTTSCTHALEMAALLLDIQSGDEVIVPSFTFVSTVNAFVLRGARPIFC